MKGKQNVPYRYNLLFQSQKVRVSALWSATSNLHPSSSWFIDKKLNSHRGAISCPWPHSLKRQCQYLILVVRLMLRSELFSSKTATPEL